MPELQHVSPLPQISVVLPVRNGMPWLPEAVRSILRQSFTDFELIVLDNASSDDSLAWLQAQRDPRLRIVPNGRDVGIAGSRNKGLELARAPYVAVMDADDVALPERLERQIARFDAQPDLVALGGGIYFITETGERTGQGLDYPEDHAAVVKALWGHERNMANPTVMFRTQAVKSLGGYRHLLASAEDYDLWLRLSEVGQLGNLQEPVLLYRVHAAAASSAHAERQRVCAALSWLSAYSRKQGLPDPVAVLSHVPTPEACRAYFACYGSDALAFFNKRFLRQPSSDPGIAQQPLSAQAMKQRVTNFFHIARCALPVPQGGYTGNAPAVTVLMPAYNAEAHLAEAVESILVQTFTDFELLIIDDASTDSTPDILREYARQDARIRLERNDRNLRIAATLNKGLDLAAAPLVARMDADDVSVPDRLEKQVAFMRAHPDITVCSGGLSLHDSPDAVWLPPIGHEAIRARLLFESCIYHAVSMYRKEPIRGDAGGYDASMPPAEDYDLWARLSAQPAARFANLPGILYSYRKRDKGEKYKEIQQDTANLVRKKLLHSIGLTPTDKEFAAHVALSLWRAPRACADLWACKRWLSKLYAAALHAEPAYDREALEKELKLRWRALCEKDLAGSLRGLIYFCSEFREDSIKRFVRFAKTAGKNAIVHTAALFPGGRDALHAAKTVLRRMQQKMPQ